MVSFVRNFSFGILLFVASNVFSQTLPVPPNGFHWQELTAIKGALLCPNGWYFKQENKNGTKAYFITKENIDVSGSFTTGLSLNCITDIPRKNSKAPSAYAKVFAEEASKKYTLLEYSTSKQGKFQSIRYSYIDAPPTEESITVQNLLIANDETGTLFLFIFEAPTKDWKGAYDTAQIIFKKMLLDDEV